MLCDLIMNNFAWNFALEIQKKMELYFLMSLISSFINNLSSNNPAYLDLVKLFVGSVLWIGGLVGFMYWRQYKLKAAVSR
jgi:hypothetical protein